MGRIMVVKQVCELSSAGVLVLLGFLGGGFGTVCVV